MVLKARFLIVTIVRNDLLGCTFLPSYYFQDQNDPDSSIKISHVTTTLESKYGISLPWIGVEKANNRNNGLIIFTQAETINNTSLFKV